MSIHKRYHFLYSCFFRKYSGDCNCDSERSNGCSQEDSPLCKENEVFINGGDSCDTSCAASGLRCQVQNIVAPRACYCKKGFARMPTGECVDATLPKCTGVQKVKQNTVTPTSPDCDACAPIPVNVCKYRGHLLLHIRKISRKTLSIQIVLAVRDPQAIAIATVVIANK